SASRLNRETSALFISRWPLAVFTQPTVPLKPWDTTPAGLVTTAKYLSGAFWKVSIVTASPRLSMAARDVPELITLGLSKVTLVTRVVILLMADFPPRASRYRSKIWSAVGKGSAGFGSKSAVVF